MSFTSPNHARALFWGLFATWLYAASVVWYAVITSHRLDPLSLGLGSISLGMLVYGTAVVHRAFAINALPFGATAFGLFGDLPAAVMTVVQIGSSAVLVLSSLVIAWVVYHAQREQASIGRSLPLAFALGLPILLYELGRRLLGIDFFDALASAIFRLGFK